jgi:hypothetical protein
MVVRFKTNCAYHPYSYELCGVLDRTLCFYTLKESKKDRQHNGKQKRTKQRSTKHHSENLRSSNKNSIKNPG